MAKMEETIPYLGAHSPQASSLQPFTMPGLWDSAAFQGLLWVSVGTLCLSRQMKRPMTQYSAKRCERSKSNLGRPFGLCSQAHELGCETQ